jgi:hypothetical protein
MKMFLTVSIVLIFGICDANRAATIISLADIVGGGNGSGTGTSGHGINPSTGSTANPAQFQISQPNDINVYNSTSVNFVNGVFIPDGGAGTVTLDSAGHTYSSFPNTDGNSWDLIKDGPFQNGGSVLSGTDYNGGTHKMIGFQANKGITFDLQQIEAANPGFDIGSFTGVFGMTHISGGFGTADWWVFVDGVLATSQLNVSGGVGTAVSVPLTSSNHYLTLFSTDHGDGNNVDQIIIGDPLVRSVPEPSTMLLLGSGAVLLSLARRTRRNS